MNLGNFLELFFVIAAGIAMPFIVIGSCFNLVSSGERTRPFAIFFFIISLIYALTYSYFAWGSIKKSDSWKRVVKGEKTEEGGKKS
ncbi:MAG: hypothetical protein I3274_05305 [Candidatus Moeniiplasma glomeromycotorum]|nr:hypothetical protein [Candidatus Moeniiplasma glomeromycotorum]